MAASTKRTNESTDGGPAPKRSNNGNTATNVLEADWNGLVFGMPFANKYDGLHIGFGFGDDRNRLALQMAKPPNTVRAPFEPKVHTTAGGGADRANADPSFVVELNDASHAKMLAFEAKIKSTAVARRKDWFGKGKHAPTAKPKTSDDQLRWDFKSGIKPGNADKGWRPTLRVGISKTSPPNILLTELKPNGKMASPRMGSVEDLVANAAIIPTIRPNGGVWTGTLGFGVKWVLETCLVVTNTSAAKGAKIDMGGVEFESEEGGEEEGAAEA
jgi:hypothetical protein